MEKKEEYYNKIKRVIYKRFDALDVEDLEHTLYLRKKGTKFTEITIYKNLGSVYYSFGLYNKIFIYTNLYQDDFEILLKMWLDDKFKIKVTKVIWII